MHPSHGLFSCVFLALVAALRPAAAQPVPDFSPLDAVVREEMDAGGIPGAAVGVVYDGRLVYAKGFGVVSLDDPRPVTPDMLFRIGSATKMFTAAALVQAAERAGASLDAPVSAFAEGLHPAVGRVTLHQLLSHTAGLAEKSAPVGPDDEAALAEEVRVWDASAFFTEPGEIHSYASRGYWLAGYVLEQITGLRYADAMDSLVFAPLGMARSTLRPLVAMTYPLAVGHVAVAGETVVSRPAANNAATWPGGSIFSNVYDLARFATAFMQDGRLDGARGLPASVVERLARPHALLPGGDGDYAYGYGLSISTAGGVRVLSHGGVSRGYGSFIQMVPEHRFAVIVFTNRNAALLFGTAAKAAEIALPPSSEAPEASEPESASITPEEAMAVVGTYVQGDLRWRITADGDGLTLELDEATYPLTRVGPGRFAYGPADEGLLVLVPGPDGRVRYLFDGLYAARKEAAP